MSDNHALQPIWDYLLLTLGEAGLGSPAFILTAVIAGIYVPGIIFSFVDVVVTRRLSLRQCGAIYWHAMKWYSTLYVVAMAVFILAPIPAILEVPSQAPSLTEFCVDLVLYFLLGDIVSYAWHRIEHSNRWYMKHVHYYHHIDKPPLTIWTAMIVHPVEGFSVFVFFHIYGILFEIHPLTFAVAAFSVTAVTMITHCGYRLPGYDWLFATAMGHHVHHSSREPRNVSVVLTICDRLFGTYQKVS